MRPSLGHGVREGDPPAGRDGSGVYDLLQPARTVPAPARRRRWPRRLSIRRLALTLGLFVAGMATGVLIAQIDHTKSAGTVVVGQKLVRPSPPRTVAHPPSRSVPPNLLTWGQSFAIDGSSALNAVSCPTSDFCAAVDDHGRVFLYRAGGWSPPGDIDGAQPLTSVSCPSSAFCVAVDQEGNALTYDGLRWSAPRPIDRSSFHELTSVSCAGPSFCATVDGNGNAFTFNGRAWSPPQQVDPLAWSPTSRDVASLSCPATGFCVGIDPEGNTFYYVGDAWQSTPTPNTNPAAPASKLRNSISCASSVSCVATENPGAVASYDGTQWSFPVVIDPTDYLSSVSCPSQRFCLAVDALLPQGYGTGNGTGEMFTYDGTTWSAPVTIDSQANIQSVSCATPQFCMAVERSGRAILGTTAITAHHGLQH